MSEMPGMNVTADDLAYWRLQYGTQEGPAKIEARRRVYDLVEPSQLFDPDLELIDALTTAGLPPNATIVDVGCARPFTLQQWRVCRHIGRLIGIEPNTEQFNELPYWTPKNTDANYEELLRAGDEASTRDFYYTLRDGTPQEGFEGIELYKAHANFIPAPSGTVDLITYRYSLGSVDKSKQMDALREGKRTLVTTPGKEGILSVGTAGSRNKMGIHENEKAISAHLSRHLGRNFIPPKPPNAGFIAEDGYLALTELFEFVYAYENEADILLTGARSVEILKASYRSLRDRYEDKNGQMPDEKDFDIALSKVIQPLVLQMQATKCPVVVDRSHRVEIHASDRPLSLPSYYQPIDKDEAARRHTKARNS